MGRPARRHTIAALNAESGAKIKVTDQPAAPGSSDRLVLIMGTEAQIEAAQQALHRCRYSVAVTALQLQPLTCVMIVAAHPMIADD